MDTRIKFLYLSEPDMIKAGVKNMDQCVEAMEDLLVTLNKGDYVMAGVNHNSHGAQVIFPDDPQFEGMPKMQTTAGLWRCRHILEENTRWQE